MNASTTLSSGEVFDQQASTLLAILDARSRDIVTRRYGIESGSVETLDSIGKEYGITRERVRQIEAQAKKSLVRREEVLEVVANTLERLFDENGGILAEDHLVELVEKKLANPPSSSLVTFYLDILSPYQFITRSNVYGNHWHYPELTIEQSDEVVDKAIEILRKSEVPMTEENLVKEMRATLGLDEGDLPNHKVYALLRASKNLESTVYDEWGLAEWVETSPRGVGDKAYIVLKRFGKPSHFRDITNLINEVSFDHKKAHEQTVHNELIKDHRFVLVGRGLYGLTEWGFIPGTVADVLEAILVKASRPMSREELLDRVLEQRMVKKTTVLLGLQNGKRFQRVDENKYTLATK